MIVGGGDGTAATAAGMLAGRDTALGILPLGTANLFAKDLNMPLDLDEAIPALAGGTVRSIDLGEVNGRLFVNNSILGLFPKLALKREHERHRNPLIKWIGIAVTAIRSMRRYPKMTVRIDPGSGPMLIKAAAIAVTNNPYADEFGETMSRAVLDTGQLAVYVAMHRGPLGLIRLALRFLFGGWQHDPEMKTIHATSLTVDSRTKRLRMSTDGEVILMDTPLHYCIRPGVLKVLVPSGAEPVKSQRTEDAA